MLDSGCFSRLPRFRSGRCRFGVHASNDRAWGRGVIASIMSRLTSSDTCNADFQVIHFDTHARAYAVRQASRSGAALINGETHTQVRRGGLSTRPPQRAALRSQASTQRITGRVPAPWTPTPVPLGLWERVVRTGYRPARITFPPILVLHDVVAIERSGCACMPAHLERKSSRPRAPKGVERQPGGANIKCPLCAGSLPRCGAWSERAFFSLASLAPVGPKVRTKSVENLGRCGRNVVTSCCPSYAL
jgi:hypothetical protein